MDYPPAGHRIKAALIDAVILLIIFTITAYVIDAADGAPSWLRAGVFVFMLYLYDPVAVSLLGGTIGHHLMRIEVRRYSNQEKRLNLLISGLRVVIKWVMGFFSIIVCYTSESRRAIHDMACDSVVVYKNQLPEEVS